jgi:CRISPR-associated protein Cas2
MDDEYIAEACIDDSISDYDYENIITEEFSTLRTDKRLVLVIYDITNNKKRLKLAKLLAGYGFRIQKSCFEAMLTIQKYEKLLSEINPYVEKNDSVRVYKIRGDGAITVFGKDDSVIEEEIIII